MKFLLSPIAIIYTLIVLVRNKLFDLRVFTSVEYDFPLIAVGNLRVGGTGKTPMIGYLLRMLHANTETAVLSRGYGRKSKGFLLANDNSSAEQIGDEPLLIKSTFPSVNVAVDEKRVRGVEKLRRLQNEPEVILLDDAMQHRSIRPGLLILLTAYNKLFLDDFPLPAGRLREPKSAANRADVIVVTKCPTSLSIEERNTLETRIKTVSNKPVFFAYESYNSLRPLTEGLKEVSLTDLSHYSVVLFSGLADPSNLLNWVRESAENVNHIEFNDHHWFSETDFERIKSVFEKTTSEKKLVLTTQKDAIRISKLLQNKKFADLPIYVIEHEMSIFKEGQVPFEKKINDFIRSYSTNA